MSFDKNIHHRRSIRYKKCDYSSDLSFFVTICAIDKKCIFGKIAKDKTVLSDTGKIIEQCLLNIPAHFPDTKIIEYVIMPNHIHFILTTFAIHGENGTKLFDYVRIDDGYTTPKLKHGTSMTLGSIIRGFKVGVVKQIGKPVFQRNYYDRIICDDDEYAGIVHYIKMNPINWTKDSNFVK